MPDPIETDPSKGFVAFPMAVFELDLSPGAFRTLAELCRMANLEGRCWPSLAQLGARLGRSRAAVSGYIGELREAGLIETETQRMANGYNYRLRYRVVFWAEWRAQMGRRSERGVRSGERPLRTQNQIHENQSPAGAEGLILEWKKCVGKAPYPAFENWPNEVLRKRTAEVTARPAIISADIIPAYRAFLVENGVAEAAVCEETRVLLTAAVHDPAGVIVFLSALKQVWKPHWRKPPAPAQLQRLLRGLPVRNSPAAQAKLLASYLKRWEIHAQSLSLSDRSARVAA